MGQYGAAAIAGRCKFQGAGLDAVFGFIMDRKYENQPKHEAFLRAAVSETPFQQLLEPNAA